MRAHEIMENASVGATCAGSIAPVASSLAWYQETVDPC